MRVWKSERQRELAVLCWKWVRVGGIDPKAPEHIKKAYEELKYIGLDNQEDQRKYFERGENDK